MRIVWRIVAALVLIAALAGIGFYAYNLGVNQQLAAKTVTTGAAPLPYYPMHPFFGMFWGPLACLIPFFLICLAFAGMRGLIFGPAMHHRMHMHGHWGMHDENGRHVPPIFDEWHRRAHGDAPTGSAQEPETDKKA
jgi:hypothetical protein